MQNDPFLQNLDDKPILVRRTFRQFGSRAYQQIHRRGRIDAKTNSRGSLRRRHLVRHHDEQVHVRIRSRHAVSVRPEQYHALRIEQSNDVGRQSENVIGSCHVFERYQKLESVSAEQVDG